MAGVSTKEIKNRIRSMESTKQITKAMEMVASSKLRRAQAQVVASRPYFELLSDAIAKIASTGQDFSSPYLTARPVKKTAYIVIAGDRGLAGGYNSNLFKLVMAEIAGKDVAVLPVGKKAVDYFRSHGVSLLTADYALAEEITLGDCFTLAKSLCKQYLSGEFDEICIAYTNFVSVLSQTPASRTLLPLQPENNRSAGSSDILYEPDSTTVFQRIIPEYLGGVLYGAAMDSATQNAEDMIADLSLQFNRARQAAITQEITEIVAGS